MPAEEGTDYKKYFTNLKAKYPSAPADIFSSVTQRGRARDPTTLAGRQILSPLIELKRWVNQIPSSHERHAVLHGRARITRHSKWTRHALVIEFKVKHITWHLNPD